MSDYTWGIDGYGRAHICKKSDSVILLSMIKGGGQMGVWLLESQDVDNLFNEDGCFNENKNKGY